MKKFLLLLSVCAASTLTYAQGNFQKAISIPFMANPTPKSIVQTSDGGYLIGSASGATSSCLIKTDALGQIMWTKSIGSSTNSMSLLQAGECMGGGYYVFGDNSDSLWTSSGWALTILDATGNILWSKVYPNTTPGYGYSKIRPTSDGGYLISESLYSKMGALKLDASGNVMWHTAFSDDPNDQSPKCPSFDCFIGSDGSMIFSGKRNIDILIVKTNSSGQMMWSSTIGNTNSYYHANGISNTADGGYIVCGYDDYNPFAMKITSTGAVSWYHAYTCASGGEFIQIKELANGNFIALGDDYIGGSFVVSISSNGSINSASTFANSSGATFSDPSMCVTSDGGYVLTGTYTNPVTGLGAVSIMKTDANGNFACNFNYYPMSFLSSQIAPFVINVPIYPFTQTTNPSTFAPVATNLSTTEMDFCLLFSTNDQHAIEGTISAFPSPIASGENLHLNTSGINGNASVSIYDANGRLLQSFEQAFSNAETNVELSTANYASGIYLVRITDNNSNILGTTRFIVR